MTARVVIANKTERGSHLSLLSYYYYKSTNQRSVRQRSKVMSSKLQKFLSYDWRREEEQTCHTVSYAYVKEVVPYEYFHICVDLHIHIIDLWKYNTSILIELH